MVKNRNSNDGSFSLRLANEGESVRISSLRGGKNFRNRLVSMGLNVGSKIKIVQNRSGGKMLVGVEGARLFLGGGMANRINVVIL
ncbi:MAG: ferrous iron transport protein A [Desulfosarcina sp.]|nr:ferrous iron transport protein A [Desulfobacterales bacterium]